MRSATLPRIAAILGLALAMAGFGPATAQTVGDTPVRGGILNANIQTEPVGLNSAINPTMFIGEVASKIMEGLVAFDADLKPVPALATRWDVSPDGLTVSFDLRKGVKWHDGKDFTAADVEFTLKEVWQKLHPFGRSAFGNVTEVETPNPHRIVLRLSAPAPYLLSYINAYGAQLLPKHLYEGTDIVNNPYNLKPVGTGPFVFKEWVKGSHIRVERNPDYWQKGQPYLDGIVFRFIPDAAARVVALQSGEVDVSVGSALPATSLGQFGDASKYAFNLIEGNYLATIAFAQFNVRNAPLSDKRVRQALAHLIDKDALLKVVYLGYGKVATGPVPSSIANYYTSDTRRYPPDPERAAQLLDEAGYKADANGRRFKLRIITAAGNTQNARTAEFIKQALGKVGVDVEIQVPDFATFLRRVFTEQDYDLMVSSMHRMPDPTLGVQRIFWTQNIRKGVPWTNGSGYSNPRLDAIMEQAAREADETKRKAQIREWQQIVQEDVPLLELVEPQWYTVSTVRFRKLALQGDGLFSNWADAWLEPKK
ncbi:ABC transporter substrate-binding protein [Pseudothauera rhizosphaerae]|uniref:ABC transporter substrate-binding protein n=1 Tax=Pseudothauera rhizosphaerae TaxID=2565932 RepID=A0A4S4AQS6_9RHOO|nr:ABC transporter substrate-binding protein [Pseudothauera rhizosphaerae]THF62119.1 ABC transporter substrate-binding protein [Pseudothauera rhizosphaerae]